MRKFCFAILLLLLVVSAEATVTFSGAELKMKPGATAQIELSMTNDAEFAGFQLDIVLPKGITVQGKTKKQQTQLCGILEELEFDYTVGTTTDGNYGIRVYSTDGLTIEPSEGKIITVNVKADENMVLGEKEIKLTNIILSQGGLSVDLEDVTFNANIYQECTFSVTNANETMGSVTGQNGTYESGKTITVSATANEGYHFVNWTSGENVVSTETSYSFAISNDVNLVANFAPNQYAMTFVLGNGEENMVKTQDYGSELTAPSDIVKTGHTFAGWNPEVPATVPLGNQTYSALWNIATYTISYDLAGGALAGDVTNPVSYTIESESITLVTPTRQGYTFAGWTGSDLTEAAQTVTIAKGSTGNLSYTATWTVNQYTMTFVLDNGDDDIVVKQDYNTSLQKPANPQREGYTFKGWNAEIPATIPAADQTYTAQWQINQYTMTFVLGNGDDDVVITQDYNTALQKPADPQREGYTFKGWDTEIPAEIPAENKTFTAQWQVNKYKVTFIVDGQTVKEGEIEYGAAIEQPDDPQKDNYTFTGWSPVVPATMPASDQTFTAQFALNPYTMTFVLGNGQNDIVKTQECGSALEAPANLQREGYTFKGWSPEVPATIPSQDMTFTAQWQINQYTMTFVLGNGEENMVKTLDYGTALEAPADLVKTGYTFQGWSPAVPETVPAGDQTYTAQWQINQYTMTFVLRNGNEDVVVTQDYNTALQKPADPQREGYTFKGWDTEIPAEIPAENKTFTAQWQVNMYKVVFIVDGQTVKEGEIEYGAAIEQPDDPQKDNYTFTGWSPVVPATMPASDQTFTAQFALNPYTMTFVLGNGEANIVKTQEYGSALEAPTNFEREGYTFTGWDKEVPSTIPAEDIVFTAQWKLNQYAIIYMIGGIEWARDMVNYGDVVTLREFTPSEGETFSGWVFENDETFTTMPAHDVTVTGSIVTHIVDVLKNQTIVDVYDLRGRLLYKKLPVNEFCKILPPGLYIVGGKKVIKR